MPLSPPISAVTLVTVILWWPTEIVDRDYKNIIRIVVKLDCPLNRLHSADSSFARLTSSSCLCTLSHPSALNISGELHVTAPLSQYHNTHTSLRNTAGKWHQRQQKKKKGCCDLWPRALVMNELQPFKWLYEQAQHAASVRGRESETWKN